MNGLSAIAFALALLSHLVLPLDVLVDAEHALPPTYAPGVHPQAQVAIDGLIAAASEDGISIVVAAGYRAFGTQDWLVSEDPKNRAMPGHSEHQLGTTFDVSAPEQEVWWIGENELVWDWVEAHAHEHGFLLTYPLKTCDEWPYSNIFQAACGVGMTHEGWHIRYVGIELAQRAFQSGYLDPLSPILPQDFYRDLDAIPDYPFCERQWFNELRLWRNIPEDPYEPNVRDC